MKQQQELRIIARPGRDSVEISVWEVYAMREHRPGTFKRHDEVDGYIKQLKESLERAGNRVTFKMMS